MSHTKDKWVIVFLIYADFRKNVDEFGDEAFAMTEQMKATLNSMFKDILTVPLDPSQARMYVIMNSIDYKVEGSPKIETKTLFYEIGNPSHLTYNQITDCRVLRNETGTTDRPNPENPVQNPDILKKILDDNISVYKDEEVFFVTWDHGSAFGIFREIDPGVAYTRIPIHYDLDCYPYLAEFWNEALKEDFELKELVDRNSRRKHPAIIQIGHTLFRLEVSSSEQSFLENSNLMTQRELTVRRKNTALDGPKFYLVYNEVMDEFEVSNDNPVAGWIDSKKVLGKLSTENVREILSNDELAVVFQEWLGADNKVGVLLMMNCWMMNLHTMYSLLNAVQCLVAPQGNIGTPGYNYKAILKYILKDKYVFVSPQQLAIKCVKTIETQRMRKRSKKLREDKSDVIDTWKVFAFDLQKNNKLIFMNHLKRLMQIIIDLHPKEQRDPNEAIRFFTAMRLVSFDFTKLSVMHDPQACFIVDVINWLNLLCQIGDGNGPHQPFPVDNNTLSLARQLRSSSIIEQMVLSKTKGEKVYDSRVAVISLQPTGYGLFFPNSISENENLIDNVRKDKLLNNPDFKWKEFIKTVYPDVWESFFG